MEESKVPYSQEVSIPATHSREQREARHHLRRLEDQLGTKWTEKTEELFLFRSLLGCHSNVYVHGANGTGKSTFVQDVVRTHTFCSDEFHVYVDCIEFNSEKLVASCISLQLNTIV